ncbi:MAG: response regulator transcription factor [Alphaproteobacteria bacterium]|nr:response regulator transcription factor [Alphaproteobacteria bacterium]
MAKIVCIADEAAIREDIAEALEMAGHDVIQACDGVQGLAAILREQPDLTISDIAMPEMDGHQLLREIRENHPSHADMPFVFLTARASREDQITGRSLGADEYLTKPVDFELMLAAVNSRLRQIEGMHQRQFLILLALCQAMAIMTDAASTQKSPAEVIDFESVQALIDAQGHSVRQLLSLISRDLPH